MRKAGIFILLVDCPKATRVVCNIEEFRIKTCISTAHQRGAIIALLFSEYLSLVPKSGPFYRRLIKNSSLPKFSQQWLGRNTLATIVKSFCIKAGFTGNYTNHSGKVTCATSLFRSGVDEQLIKKQTSHRSDSVWAYKRTILEQDAMVSNILQPPQHKKPEKENEPPSERSMPLPGGVNISFSFYNKNWANFTVNTMYLFSFHYLLGCISLTQLHFIYSAAFHDQY